jgi:hypothetical protein
VQSALGDRVLPGAGAVFEAAEPSHRAVPFHRAARIVSALGRGPTRRTDR